MSNLHPAYQVVIVDDHLLFAEGFRRILQSFKNIDQINIYESGEDFLNEAKNLAIDIVFMDLRLNGVDGIETTRRILKLKPKLKVVAVTSDDDGYIVNKALDAGFCAFITKDLSVAELKKAFDSIMKGNKYITQKAAQNYALFSMRTFDDLPKLTKKDFSEREINIIRLIDAGKSEKEIANILKVSIKTVENEKRKISDKMMVKKSAQIISIAYRLKILP